MEVNKAIFIDKDGTLIPDVPYNIKLEHICLSDNAISGLFELQQQGYLIIVISNQAGIAHGYFDEDALGDAEQKIKVLLQEQGIKLDAFYYCPHHPEATLSKYRRECDCRKPQPGMLFKAAADFHIDLSQSWMIGDILNDIEAGHRAGCHAVLIHNGNETEWKMNYDRVPDALVDTIDQAATHIINHHQFTTYKKQ